jgi:DNA repair protein RadD
LSAMLAFEGIKAYSLDSRFDDPESRRFKISEYSEGRVKILINYSILTAGFDAPITNVAIIARPTDSLVQYSQMAGRAMRGVRSKGNTDCRIYTVQDDIPAFKSVIHAFEHWDELWSEV